MISTIPKEWAVLKYSSVVLFNPKDRLQGNFQHPAKSIKSGMHGSGGFGNIPFGMKMNCLFTWITFTIIRSSMVWFLVRTFGLILAFKSGLI